MITEAGHQYYILDSPTISDIDYDTKIANSTRSFASWPAIPPAPS